MPISNTYASETVQPTDIANSVALSSECSISLHSKSSINSERFISDSPPGSRVDSQNDSPHIYPHKKERRSIQIERSENPKQQDFGNSQNAYYSDFYDSTEQLPAVKKCENFHRRSAYSNSFSGSDNFQKMASRRFSLNPEVLRRSKVTKNVASSCFSLDDMATYHQFIDSFYDWNGYFGKPASRHKSVSFEENMSVSSSSDSVSYTDSDCEQSLRKSIQDYFKNRVNRDSTSSLCTSHSGSYAMKPFPEEIVDMNDEPQTLNSSTLGNCQLPSLLNLRPTLAEQMLVNLGFCDSSEIIPARFLTNLPKQDNGEAAKIGDKEEMQAELSENKKLENSKDDDISTQTRKKTEIDSNATHLLMKKKNPIIGSCRKTKSLDFEEINRSTVHVINNNKRVFYKQKSIHDEIEEASRNALSGTFEDKPKEESFANQIRQDDCDQKHQEAQNSPSNFKKKIEGKKDESEKDQNSQKLKENSGTPNITVSKKISISSVPKRSQESFEIESILEESEQKSYELKDRNENSSKESVSLKNTDNKNLNSSLLSISCTSSPVESPLTVIDMSLNDFNSRISEISEEDQSKKLNQSFIDWDSDDTFNDKSLEKQFDELFMYNLNSLGVQEEPSKSIHYPTSLSKTVTLSASDIEEPSSHDESCCWDVTQLVPYLTSGPDLVTISKTPSKVFNETQNKKTMSPEFTSSFKMFIKGSRENRAALHSSDEKESSNNFSPLVINGIRFDGSDQSCKEFSERGFADGEDATYDNVSPALCFSLDPAKEKTNHCSRKSENKRDQFYKSKDSPVGNKEEKNVAGPKNGENKDSWPKEIKVSKARIIFKMDPQSQPCTKITCKTIRRNVDQNQRRKVEKLNAPYKNDKYRNNSWTQCNFDDHEKKENFCKMSHTAQNMSKNFSHQEMGLQTKSKEKKLFQNKKKTQTRANTLKNSRVDEDLKSFKKGVDPMQDFITDLNQRDRFPDNSHKERAVLSLHKSSQTRIWGSYPSCKNELNICAECLSHMNWPRL